MSGRNRDISDTEFQSPPPPFLESTVGGSSGGNGSVGLTVGSGGISAGVIVAVSTASMNWNASIVNAISFTSSNQYQSLTILIFLNKILYCF